MEVRRAEGKGQKGWRTVDEGAPEICSCLRLFNVSMEEPNNVKKPKEFVSDPTQSDMDLYSSYLPPVLSTAELPFFNSPGPIDF